jgi:CO dehydrogenase maturation factor
VLKEFIDRLQGNYRCLVMDNEAGMEHLSRRTTENIDLLILASDYSVKGLRTLGRIRALVAELKLDVRRLETVVTRVPPGEMDDHIQGELRTLAIKPLAFIPQDEAILHYDLERRSLLELPDSSPAVEAINRMMSGISIH